MTTIGVGTERAPTLAHAREGHSLTVRASLTAFASWLDYVTRLVVGLLLTPVLLAQLGVALFGVWEMLQRLASYAALADGRPMETLRLVVARGEGRDNAHGQRQAVAMAVTTWLVFVPVIGAAGAVIVWCAPMAAGVSGALVRPVRVGAALLVLNLLLLTLVALPEAVLSGVNQGYRRMGLVAGAHVAGGVLMVMSLRAGFGLAGLAAAQVIVTLGTALLFLRLTRACVPWFGLARPDPGQLTSFMRLSAWSVAGDAVAKIALASDIVILGALASTTAVTAYVLTAYASQAAVGVVTLGLGAAVPGLALVAAAAGDRRAVQLRQELLVVGWLVATVVGTVIVLWNRSFLALWVGPQHGAGRWVNALLALMLLQTVLIRCEAAMLNALLQLRIRVLVSAVAAVLACSLAVVLVPAMGVAGLCLGLCLGRLVQSVGLPLAVNGALGRAPVAGWRACLRPVAASALLLAASVLVEPRLHAATWLALGGGIVASGTLLLPAAAATGLTPHQRAGVWQRVTDVARGRSASA